jgi:predicted DNA-binding transcriptional regulator YafY
VRFTYTSRARQQAERVVSPLGLADKDDIWYLIAGTDNGQRTFRVDRMVDIALTDLPAERPDDFDLSAEWNQVVDEVEQRRGLVAATVLAQGRHVRVLQDQFGRHCEVLGDAEDGRVRVRLAASAPIMIAQVLAGWGALVDVEESDSVKAELARLGSELVVRYGT